MSATFNISIKNVPGQALNVDVAINTHEARGSEKSITEGLKQEINKFFDTVNETIKEEHKLLYTIREFK